MSRTRSEFRIWNPSILLFHLIEIDPLGIGHPAAAEDVDRRGNLRSLEVVAVEALGLGHVEKLEDPSVARRILDRGADLRFRTSLSNFHVFPGQV